MQVRFCRRHMPAISSSAISEISYDWSSRLLFITFHSGGTYTFYRVPPDIYQGLISASSAGRFYHTYIRGRYGP